MPINANDIFGSSPSKPAATPSQAAPQGRPMSASDLFGGNVEDDGAPAQAVLAPQQEERPASFMDGLKYGGKEALNPFGVDIGEQKKVLSSKEAMAGYLLGNIGTSLAGNAAITAATAGAAGSVGLARQAATAKNIASFLWAAYQGLGRDRIQTREEGRTWKPLSGGKSTATALLTVGLEANPLFKASSKLNAALRIGAQGAGEAAREAVHGGDAKDMSMAAALGIVGAGLPLAASLRKGPASEAVLKDVAEKTMEEALQTQTPEIFTKAQAKLAELEKARPDFAKLTLEELPTEFKRFVVGDSKAELDSEALEKVFATRSKGLGAKKLDELYTLGISKKAYTEAAGEAVEENFNKMGIEFKEPSLPERLLMPMFYVSRQIDNVTGLDTSKLVDKFSQAHNRHNTVAKYFTDKLVPLQDEAKRLGLSGKDVTNLITMEDDGAYKAIASRIGEDRAADYRARLQDIISGEKGMLGYLKELGYSPTMRANYMPMKAVSSTRMASILQGEMEKLPTALKGREIGEIRLSLEKAAAQEGGLDALKASDSAAKTIHLVDRITERLGLPPISSAKDFAAVREQLLSGARWAEDVEGIPDSLGELSALFARKGEVPSAVRERDAWKLLGGYINENLRAAHFEDALNYGRMYTGVLEKMGMPKAAELFENYVKDQAGGARFLNGAMRKLNSKIEFAGAEMVRRATGKWDRRLGQAIEAMPEFTSWLNQQVYPAKLALNVPGIIRNSTQFMATTIPELGATGTYGTKKAIAAARSALRDADGVARIVREMEDKGLFSNHGKLETSEFGNALGGLKGKLDKFNDKLFTAYQATDKFNRVLTWKMGREVAADILKNDKDAIKFVDSLDSATKQRLRAMLQKPMGGKEKLDAVHDLVGRYLISKTQFDYSTANKAEWARLVGPMFSMFTTWPAMVGSDIATTLSSKGALQGGKKVLAKYLPFYGLMTLAGAGVKGLDNDATNYLFSDMTSYSPLDSVLPSGGGVQGRGGLLSNPLVENAGKAVKSAATLNYKGLGRQALTEGMTTYAPVVSPILNEVDRFTKVVQGKKLTKKVADKLGLKEDK